MDFLFGEVINFICDLDGDCSIESVDIIFSCTVSWDSDFFDRRDDQAFIFRDFSKPT